MVWEKSIDTNSTEIWIDNILDENPAEAVLSNPGIHYTHPKIMGQYYGTYGDTLFFLFYQTDQNSNQDIYFKAFLSNGLLSDSEPYATTPYDDEQLSIYKDIFYDGNANLRSMATWISNGDLYSRNLMSYNGAYYFMDKVKIDSGGCSHPSVGWYEYQESVVYNKADSAGNYLCKSKWNYSGLWDVPVIYFDSLESMNPTASSYYGDPCWSIYSDTSWKIIISYNGLIPTEYFVYDITSPQPFDPAVLGVFHGVKASIPEIYVAVVYPENNIDEIYMTDLNSWPAGFQNFSNSSTMNRNPCFFAGEQYPYNFWCWYNYLVWESFRNGHWQIWAAKYIMCAGSVDEIEDNERFISAYPNPFGNETTMEFTLESRDHLVIDVYDNGGMLIATIADQVYDRGKHQLRWNAENLPTGVYIIKMTVGEKMYTTKVIKSN